MTQISTNRPALGIAFICAGIFFISINDMLIKLVSGDYPLHQIIAARSGLGLILTLGIVQFEGGIGILRTDTPVLHLIRGLLVVIANMAFYAAVAVLPLAQVTALFFVAPLFITLLSIPILGEKVGPLRLGAIVVGLIGVVVMQAPWGDSPQGVPGVVLLLPVAAALTYAGMQVLTRKLGVKSKASALAIYIQTTFLLVSLGFFLVAGDGRFHDRFENESLQFLLRPWILPDRSDLWVFLCLGALSASVGYCLSQAYRVASAATVAPFEYLGLPLAVFWGWAIFAEWPEPRMWVGIALIVGAGLFVFLREQQKTRAAFGSRSVRRAMRR